MNMATTMTEVGTRLGVLQLRYREPSRPPTALRIATTVAAVGALCAATERAVELDAAAGSTPADRPDAWTISDLIGLARFVALESAVPRRRGDNTDWERASALALGVRSFVDAAWVRKPRGAQM
jgi:hypothetical protein